MSLQVTFRQNIAQATYVEISPDIGRTLGVINNHLVGDLILKTKTESRISKYPSPI